MFHLPTCVNNVESLSLVAPLLLDDEGYYKSQGTPDCPGTKMISVCGNVKSPGVFEVPFGITIREIIYDLAGGMETEDYPLRLVQLGGASGASAPPPNWTPPIPIRGCVRPISPPSAPARCWWWTNAPASSAFCA